MSMLEDGCDPRVMAKRRRHRREDGAGQRPPCPADRDSEADCVCVPMSADAALVWQGRARMAAARQAAGVRLDPFDRQALDRYPTTSHEGP